MKNPSRLAGRVLFLVLSPRKRELQLKKLRFFFSFPFFLGFCGIELKLGHAGVQRALRIGPGVSIVNGAFVAHMPRAIFAVPIIGRGILAVTFGRAQTLLFGHFTPLYVIKKNVLINF